MSQFTGKIVKNLKFGVRWRVKNFEALLCDLKTGECIKSPSFTDSTGKTRWRMLLYPHGNAKEFSNHVSLFVSLESPGPVKAQFYLAIINSEGGPCQEEKDTSEFGPENYDGFNHFISREKLRRYSAELLPNGHLTLHCEMTLIDNPYDTRYPLSKQCLASSLRAASDFDLTLVVEKENIPAHRLVLGAVSPVFRAMFAHDTKENKENRVVIKDIKANIVRILVDFAYDEPPQLYSQPLDLLEELFVAADRYQIDALRQLCTRHLAMELNEEKATRLLLFADRFHIENLYAHILLLIKFKPIPVMTSSGWIDAIATHADVIQKALKAIHDSRDSYEDVDEDEEDSDSNSESESETSPPAKRLKQ